MADQAPPPPTWQQQYGTGSLQGFLYQAMAIAAEFNMELLSQQFELLQLYPEVANTMVEQFMESAFAAAEEAAKALRKKAIGDGIGAGFGAVSLVGMGGSLLNTRTGSLEDQLKQLDDFATKLTPPVDNPAIMAGGGHGGAALGLRDIDPDAANQFELWRKNPQQLRNDLNEPKSILNDPALAQKLKTTLDGAPAIDGIDELRTSVQTARKQIEGEIEAKSRTWGSAMQGLNVFGQTGNSAGSAIGGMMQAPHEAESRQLDAVKSVIEKSQQQILQAMQALWGDANKLWDAVQQNASQYGSMQQTRHNGG